MLFAVRNLLWQLDLTDEEKKLLNFSDEEKKLLRKILIPKIRKDAPIFAQQDMYSSMEGIRQYGNPALALQHIYANDILIEYVNQQVDMLLKEEGAETTIILDELTRPIGNDQEEMRFLNMLANQGIRIFIENQINNLKVLANPPKEMSEAEKEKKLAKDSAK